MALRSKWRMTVETITAGQPRPYADSQYIYHVLLEHTPYTMEKGYSDTFEPWDIEVKVFEEHYAKKVASWGDDPAKWWEEKLQHIRKLEPGKFEIYITRAFTD